MTELIPNNTKVTVIYVVNRQTDVRVTLLDSDSIGVKILQDNNDTTFIPWTSIKNVTLR